MLGKIIKTTLLWLSVSPLACVVLAQQGDATLDKLAELNRSGQWEQAVRMAQTFLISGEPKSQGQRCRAYYELASAQNRLGREEEAKGTLAVYDKECGKLTGESLNEGVARLRAELTAQPPPTAAMGDDFWQ